MPIITELKAKEILDSRSTPTVSVFCMLDSGATAEASVPSGASTGIHEAHELRDGDISKYRGKGVYKAIYNVNTEIYNSLKDKKLNQEELDKILIKLDGTKNKSRLGANAILGVSLAFARACANEKKVELYEHLADIYLEGKNKKNYTLPTPAFNIINGGKHATSGLTFQEFMIIPVGFSNLQEKIEAGNKIIEKLKELLIKDNFSVSLGDEGGFAPKLGSNEKAFVYIENAITESGFDKDQIKLGIDVAATTFYKEGQYKVEENKILNTRGMIDMYKELANTHNIISIEDGLYEEDFAGFTVLNKELGDILNIVGDDLTVTNTKLIKKAIKEKSINTLLIKPNQIGTLTETLEAIKLAKKNNIKIFVSHRSGETMDTFIVDLSVAVGADFIKAGSLTKNERLAKYNRLLEIENILNKESKNKN